MSNSMIGQGSAEPESESPPGFTSKTELYNILCVRKGDDMSYRTFRARLVAFFDSQGWEPSRKQFIDPQKVKVILAKWC